MTNPATISFTTYASVRPLSSFGSLLGAEARATLQAAMNAAAGQYVLEIDRSCSVTLTSVTDPILIPDGLQMVFRPGVSITMSGFGLPLFYGINLTDVLVISPIVYYAGTSTTWLPSVTATFRSSILNYPGVPQRDCIGAFAIYGAVNVTIRDAEFYATNFSNSNRFLPRAIIFLPSPSGDLCTDCAVVGRTILDGVNMGVLGAGLVNFSLGDVDSYHWGNLDVTQYTWDVASHAVYISGFNGIGSTGVTTGRLTDYGQQPTAKPYTANGPYSFKFVTIDGFKIGDIYSQRAGGALESRLNVKNGSFGKTVWDGSAAVTADVSSGMVQFGATAAGENVRGSMQDVDFGQITLIPPSDWNNVAVGFSGSLADTVPDVILRCKADVTILYGGSALSRSTPMFRGRVTDCVFNFTVIAPGLTDATAPGYVLMTFDGGGYANSVSAKVNGPPLANIRVLENIAPSGTQNYADVVDAAGGNSRHIVNSDFSHDSSYASVDVTCTSGPTLTVSGLLPDGCVMTGLSTKVLTDIGNSNGLTGYTVGAGANPDRWGLTTGRTAGSASSNANWGQSTIQLFTTNQAIALTAVGGDFDGIGTVRIMVSYTIDRVL